METLANQALLKCLESAKQANCPQEQANNFVSTGYVPSPRQWLFHAQARAADHPDGPVEIAMGGARGGGKSHSIFAQAALDDCQRVSNLKVLFIRKTAISAKESFGDLIERILQGKVSYSIANNIISFQNGSRILLGGFHSEDDIDKYVGVEYDLIVIEELNQLTEDKLEKLRGSLRTSKPNWRPRLYVSFNPGGIGHNLVKARYVIPARLGEQGKTRFISATYTDNQYLNPEYVDYLEGLQGDLGQAWREGNFDLFAGQFFKEWNERIHTCQPFALPEDWNRFAAFDYGLNHPLSIGWYAVSPDSQVFKYRQLHGSGMTYTQAAEEYTSMTMPNENIQYVSCDPALWAKKGENEDMLSGAEIFARRVGELTGKQPRLIRAENARVTGWGVVREYLRPYLGPDNVLTAKLQVFSTCYDTIKSAPEQVHSETVPEDMAKQDGDDSWDECVVAGTIIETFNGGRKIEDMRIGEYVLTRDGYKEVTAVFTNGIKPVFSIAGLTATANHPVWIEGKGYIPLADIRYGDMIRSCTQINTEKLQESYGQRISERFQKGVKSITRIITKRIITSRILCVFRYQNIREFITKKCQSLLNNVSFVGKSIRQKLLGRDCFVLINASHNLGEIVPLMTSPSSVSSVVQPLSQVNIQDRNIVLSSVMQDSTNEKLIRNNVTFVEKNSLQKIGVQFGAVTVAEKPIYVGERKVYNLSVADSEEYFANGLLTHNCRYALMSRPRPTHTPEQIAKREFDQAMKKKAQRLSPAHSLRFMKL